MTFFLYFLGFSPTNLLENSGLTVSDNIEDIILSRVLEKMGVTDYLQTPQCDLMDYTDTVDGWKNGQIMLYCLYLFVTHELMNVSCCYHSADFIIIFCKCLLCMEYRLICCPY
jgi:hypothetical protein